MKLNLKEAGRKLFHLIWFIVLIGYLRYGRPFLLIIFFVIFVVDILRLEFGFYIPGLFKLLRKTESKNLFTPTYTLLGMLLALLLFEQKIAVTAVSMMIFGDLTAAVVGPFGKINVKDNKSLEGGVAEFLVNLIVGIFTLKSWLLITAMAFTATLVERISIQVNDNLTIPLFAGIVGELLMLFSL